MLFVLAGPSYVGKKTALYHFIKLYSFSSIIPYTTKADPNRTGEVEGIHYHYIQECDSAEIENEDKFIFDKPFDIGDEYHSNDLYAYKKSDIENAIKSHANFIIHASVGNAIKIHESFKDNYESQIYIIFLRYDSDLTDEFFKERCPFDVQTEEDKYKKRFLHAKKEVHGYNTHKLSFDTLISCDKTYNICDELEKYILPKLEVMPTSPDKIPGPLSDNDLLYTFENRKNDKLIVKKSGKEIEKDEFSKMLCGCGMHITLSKHIRKIKLKPNNFIDMSDSEDNIDQKLKSIFGEATIRNGYILKPYETIFCSSNEEIQVPHDIYAIVSSKFSYAQLGLSIELGTSIIQSGHKGKIHFQIKNQTENYIRIYSDIEVAQLVFYRTILPSSVAGSNSNQTHQYDKEQSSPISKFRENNSVLDKVKRKTNNLNGFISDILKERLVHLLGIVIATVFAFFTLKNKITYIDNIVFPIIKNMSTVSILFNLSIIMWILNIIFYVIGDLFCKLIKLLKKCLVRVWAYCFGVDQEE